MGEAKTLLELAGATWPPALLTDAVLVIIDCQMEYVTGGLTLPNVGNALAEGARVLAKARDAGTPIFHVAHHGSAGGLFDPDGPMSAIAPEVAPADGETTVIKKLPNAFAGTPLAELIEGTGRKELIVMGFMTHMCVSSTVRAGLDLGYKSTVVADAAATRDLPDGRGGLVKAADLHRASLSALSDRFAAIAHNADDLKT